MILIEDKELEESVIAGVSCIAVPFEIWVPENGESQITVYSYFEKVAEKYESIFGNRAVEANALNWLEEELYAPVKDLGYEHQEEEDHHLCEYAIDDLSQLRNCVGSADVKLVSGEDEIGASEKELISDIHIDDPAAVVVKDDKLVCVACVNDIAYDDESLEIYVETLPEYRGVGLATDAVYTLVKAILEKGKAVRYICAKNNFASVRVAEKCGFAKTGERYSYVCYSID